MALQQWILNKTWMDSMDTMINTYSTTINSINVNGNDYTIDRSIVGNSLSKLANI